MKKRASTSLVAALGWTVFAIAVNLARFGRVPGSAEEVAVGLLGFALLGAVTGARLALLPVLAGQHLGWALLKQREP